ncbi:MAG: glutamate-1-semialdehyde 2,1-aminomutase [Opitutales bacterium]|nr:glutamate-1-semialdehyde 2,1-aminomutase [Opitutales bacterium]
MAAPNSSDLFKKALRCIPGGVNSPVRAFRSVGGEPFFTVKADGSRLYTADNNSLIDYVCTWGPAIHGHNHPVIRESLALALQRGTSFGTPGPLEVEMAETLVEMVPSVEKVRMVNSGTEATLSAIRLARGFTGRNKIIKFAGCYHGHVDSLLISAGSGALTLGQPDSAGIPPALAAETIVLPFNDASLVREAFAKYAGEIAAIILEPYPANVGLILPEVEYLRELREICTQQKAVLIFDEVMTGFRIAPGGVQEETGVTPDLTAMGKIIGGGLPVGAFGGKAEIMDYLAPDGPVYQAGTLSGNPLAMAAGLSSLNLLRENDPYQALAAKGAQIAAAVKEAAESKGLPLQVPQRGSMFCLYFSENPVRNYADATSSQTGLFKKVFHQCLQEGIYLPPSPFETCFISTEHSEEDLEKTCQVLSSAIHAL